MAESIHTEGIPIALRQLPSWLLWCEESAGEGKKPRKIPCRVGTTFAADAHNPDTWCSCQEAIAGINGHKGVGFSLAQGDYGIVFIDLDHVRNPQTGETLEWAWNLIVELNSYTEVSPSGTGYHMFVLGALREGHRTEWQFSDGSSLEIYTRLRFATFTGQRLESFPAEIQERGNIADIYHRATRGGLGPDAKPSNEIADIETITEAWTNRGLTVNASGTAFDINTWMQTHGVEILRTKPKGSGTIYIIACPGSHGDYDKRDGRAFIMQHASGALSAGCLHSSCSLSHLGGNRWRDLRQMLEPAAFSSRGNGHQEQQTPAAINQYSDDDLALFFSSTYAADLRYTPDLGSWSRYDNGQRWLEIPTVKVYDLARSVVRTIASQAPPKQRHNLLSARTVNAITTLARGDSRHLMPSAQWDSDPWLLNTPSGVVDLRTGTIRLGEPEDYMTRMTAVGPGGECPQWLNFLERITDGDKELQSFLQRYAGYSLTGVTVEHKFVFGHGTGANGKGRYCYALAGIMGDYAISAAPNMFMLASNDRHPTEIADLVGARLVIAEEIKSGNWDEVRLKQFTGGDPLKARRIHQNFFQFLPQFKLFLTGNQRPALRSVDEAIRRRLCLVPFEVTIPEKERDSELDQKLRKEWPGILRWMIAGCLEWQRQGLNAPAAVLAASAEYLAQEDATGRWIEEQCEAVPRFSATAILFASWKVWAERNNEYTGSVRSFSQNLAGRQGLKRDKVNGVRGFTGIWVKGESC